MALNFPDPATQTPVNTWSPTSTPSATTNGTTYTWDGEKWRVSGSPAFVNISGDTMTGDLTVPSLNEGPLAGLRNALANSDFRIWQRGVGPFSTTTPSSSLYTADRWYVGTNNIAVSRNAVNTPFVESFDRAVQSTASGNFSIAQMVELKSQGSNSQFYVGSTWTLSFWAKHDPGDVDIRVLGQFADDSPGANGVSVFDQTGGAGLVAGDTWQRLSFTFTVGATAALTNKGLAVYIRATTTGTFTLTGVQLEPGPVATPFEHRPYGTELALCQRYYYAYSNGGLSDIPYARSPYSGGYTTAPNTSLAVALSHPVRMRVGPTAGSIQGSPTAPNRVTSNGIVWAAQWTANPGVVGGVVYPTFIAFDAEL